MINDDNNNMENHIEVILNGQLSERRMASFLEECKIFVSNKAFAAYLGQEDRGDRDFFNMFIHKRQNNLSTLLKKHWKMKLKQCLKL